MRTGAALLLVVLGCSPGSPTNTEAPAELGDVGSLEPVVPGKKP